MRNKRCEILEVPLVTWIHVVLSFIHHISTTHISSNENINISNGKQSCNGNTGIFME